ncbi:MAG: hypothetical protein GY794_04955 [bacterium]|nr:hypothetical protein [bacterium]
MRLGLLFALVVLPAVEARGAPPAVSDKGLKALLDAIDKSKPLEYREIRRLTGSLGARGAMLSKAQAEQVWTHYAKVSTTLDIPGKRRGRPTPPTYSRASGKMTQTTLYWNLIGRMHPESMRAIKAAEFFPGKVAPEAKTISKTVTIDTTRTRWQSTGLYAAPGALITVTIPKQAVDKTLVVQIGCHKDNLHRKNSLRRWPAIVIKKSLSSIKTQIANPFGGLVYVIVPNNAKPDKKIAVQIDGAVASPRFVLGKTSPLDWKNRVRTLPGPWAELESDKLVTTIPSSMIRKLDDPTLVVTFWKKVADAQDDLSGRQIPRYQERMVCDIQISAGALHSGYPMMGHLNHAHDLYDYAKVSKSGTWGWFHELGHNHQRAPWRKPVEVSVNIFSMYTMETVVGLQTEQVNWYKKCIPAARKFYASGLDDNKPAWTNGYALPLAMYMQMRKEFGWEFYKKIFRHYEKLGPAKWPRKEQDRRDLWLVLSSQAAKRNLSPFYDRWGFTTTDKAKAKINTLPKWDPKDY